MKLTPRQAFAVHVAAFYGMGCAYHHAGPKYAHLGPPPCEYGMACIMGALGEFDSMRWPQVGARS